MTRNQTLVKQVSSIGEEIGLELGNEMVLNFQENNQDANQFYVIGRNIIDQILAQPGCAGIKFYNAYNEMGEQTMVYVGLDKEGKTILEYSSVNQAGALETYKGIVADRIERGGPKPPPPGGISADDWNLEVA